MTNDEYTMVQEQVLVIARLACMVPVEKMLASIDRAETLGSIVDPTLWRQGHERLAIIKEIAQAVNGLKQVVVARRQHLLDIDTMDSEPRARL